MSVSAFPYGVVAAAGALPAASLSGQSSTVTKSGQTATASYQIRNDGVALITNGIGGSTIPISGEWETAGLPGSKYQVYFSVTSGTLSSGPVEDTWLDCSSSYACTVSQVSVGTKTCTFTVEIRNKATTVSLAGPVSVTLTATRSS
jgi:hypothetical protein